MGLSGQKWKKTGPHMYTIRKPNSELRLLDKKSRNLRNQESEQFFSSNNVPQKAE